MPGLTPVSADSNITTFNPLQRSQCQPPQLVIANSNTSVDVYNELLDPKAPKAKKIVIQNQGQDAVKFAFNTVCNAAVFHGTLIKATAADDGSGGRFTFNVAEDGIQQISIFCAATAIRVTVEQYNKA